MAFAVVGDAAIITEPPPPNTADPCAYLKTAKRFDVEEIVRKFLETSGSNSLVDLDLSPLLNSISDQFTAFGAGHADLLKKFAGETLFTVVIASYVPAQQTSLFVYFSALLGRDQKVAFSPPETKRYTSDLEASYKLFGESRYVELYVTSPYGSIFYDPKIWKALEGHRIGVITRDQAANFARHLVDATARVTGEIVPASGSIGGPIGLLSVGRESQPEHLQ